MVSEAAQDKTKTVTGAKLEKMLPTKQRRSFPFWSLAPSHRSESAIFNRET
jgi:hypothetical protein